MQSYIQNGHVITVTTPPGGILSGDAMVVGNICWFRIVDLLPANVAGLSSILVPIVAMVSGAIALGEPLGPLQWLAMVLSTSAITIAMRAQRRTGRPVATRPEPMRSERP